MITTTRAGEIIKRTPQTVRRMCEAGTFKTAVRVSHYWLVEEWEATYIAREQEAKQHQKLQTQHEMV